ncbi:MAG: hypothetical protein LQ340_001888 [Diploschistes diacapsis]|nr:MAG: hypothetical protein LQ340_001888 [Diploschistes diacapsis]
MSDGGMLPPNSKRFKDFNTKVVMKTKGIVGRHLGRVIDLEEHRKDQSVLNTEHDAAFHPRSAKQYQSEHHQRGGPLDKIKVALETSAEAVVHPKQYAQSKAKRVAAGKISSIQKPYNLPATGAELLDAHDAYSQSDSSRASDDISDSNAAEDKVTKQKSRAQKKARLDNLEAQKESMRVAWTTRHIDRVRVVPKKRFRFPDKEAFIERSENGSFVRYRWDKWLGHFVVYYTQDFSAQYIDDFDELPFDIDTTRNHAERLVMASAPWQTWAMDVRSVYRWEDPYRTGRWFLLYLILWYYEHIGTFLWACILYYTIRNRYYPSSMKHLRAALRRSADTESAAFQFGELIDKHGRDSWLDPLIDEVGPYVQLQLSDLANLLEVLSNFYSWKYPRKTAASLILFAACFITALLADMAFCMKIVYFIAGGSFFLCWPISSRYPRYRYLVSPVKWMMWDIPTHAEWAFQYLRQHCQESREAMIINQVEKSFQKELEGNVLEQYAGRLNIPHPHTEFEGVDKCSDSDSTKSEEWHSADSSNDFMSETSFLSYRSHWNGMSGRLAVTPSGLRFFGRMKKQEMWYVPFIEIEEMRKFQGAARSGSNMQGVQSKRLLELRRTDGRCFTLELRNDRDEIFNYIIGFSGLQWQSLQPGSQRATRHA